MNFSESVKSLFTNCLKTSGRATRSEYWYSCLFLYVVASVLGVLLVVPVIWSVASPLFILWLLFAVISHGICMMIRRLHDSNQTAWWLLLYLLPFGNFVLFIFAVLPSSPVDNNSR